MKKIIILLLIATFLLASISALADSGIIVATSGDTHIRTGPGLDYTSIGVLHRGQALYYTGFLSIDWRGVAWYEVYLDYGTAWVSSRYTTLYY